MEVCGAGVGGLDGVTAADGEERQRAGAVVAGLVIGGVVLIMDNGVGFIADSYFDRAVLQVDRGAGAGGTGAGEDAAYGYGAVIGNGVGGEIQ